MMNFKTLVLFLSVFSASLFAFTPNGSSIDDRAKFLSEKDRDAYLEFTDELYSKTHFSLYLYTTGAEVREPKPIADSLCNFEMGNDSLRAIIFIDGSAKYRYLSISPAAKKFLSEDAAERLAQKYLLPEFRKDRYSQGILVFAAELSKNVARFNDVRLTTPLPRPSKDGLPPIAWFLIVTVIASVIIAYAYFVRQSKRADQREKIRDFGGFPHNKFDFDFKR